MTGGTVNIQPAPGQQSYAGSAANGIMQAGAPGRVKLGSFDMNQAALDRIQHDAQLFAIDQQPYLQGYLAADALWLYITNRNVIGGGQPTLTGPSFVDESNVESVGDRAKEGTR